MKITFSDIKQDASEVAVFTIAEDLKFSSKLKAIDEANAGVISKVVEENSFKAKKGSSIFVTGGVRGLKRVILLGVGSAEEGVKEEKDVIELGGKLYSLLNTHKIISATLTVEEPVGGFAADFVAANIAYGVKLKSYRFDKYKTKQKDEDKPKFTDLEIVLNGHKDAIAKFKSLEAIANGVFLARDVVTEPPNVLYPESYAERCKDLKSLGVKVEVLGEKELQKLGMGSLLCVGQGSRRESKVVVMQYNGAPKSSQPVAFIGKGVCFDTGGISIKPSNGMEDMKYDMGGSASVYGTMAALAGRKAKVNAIGIIGLVENMPDGEAVRPSDVVTSMSGQTIEVLNTDAEGRLVLADILWYAQERFKPRFMIDLATLTGAIVVTLGQHRAGIFGNDDELADRLYKSGEETGERVWRLPLGDEYDKQIDSKIADVQNISNMRGGGSITAAQFLQRFVNDCTWTHIDIAGVAWADKAKDITPEGAVGYGVRLLDRLVANYYES